MNENDLIIDIGADLSSFKRTIDQAKVMTTEFTRSLASKPAKLEVDIRAYQNSLNKAEKEFQDFYKKLNDTKGTKVDEDVARRYIALSKAAEVKVANHRKSVIKELEALGIRADRRRTTKNLENQIKLAKREQKIINDLAARKKRVNDYLFQRRLRQLKVERVERAKVLAGQKSPWGNIESVRHAAKTTALYGAMAQVLFGLQNAMHSVVIESLRFNQSIADIGAVLNFTRAESFKVATEITNLSIRYGEATEGIQEATLTLGRAGVDDVNELISAMENLTALSIITGDSVSDGANAMASMLSVFGKEGLATVLDDSGIAIVKYSNKTEELANRMAAVANATRLGLADFSTIANYALTSAKAIGLTSEAYYALAGAMSKVGLNASTIGTSIRRLGKITTDTSESVQNFFLEMSLSQVEFARIMRDDSIEAINVLSKAMAELPADKLAEIMPNQIQMRATLNTLKQIYDTQGIEAMQEEMKKYGFVTEQADKAAIGLNRALTSIGNTVKQMYNQEVDRIFFKMFYGVNVKDFHKQLEDIIDTVKDILYWVVELGKAFIVFKLAVIATNKAVVLSKALSKLPALFRLMQIRIASATTTLKTFSAITNTLGKSNIIITAILVAFETWNYITQKQTDDLDALHAATTKTAEAMAKLTTAQAKVELRNVEELIKKRKEERKLAIDNLREAAKAKVSPVGPQSVGSIRKAKEALFEAKARLDTEEQSLKKLEKQKVALTGIIDGTTKATEEAKKGADETAKIEEHIRKATLEAIKLTRAMENAGNAMLHSANLFDVAIGKLSQFDADSANIGRQFVQTSIDIDNIVSSLIDQEEILQKFKDKNKGVDIKTDPTALLASKKIIELRKELFTLQNKGFVLAKQNVDLLLSEEEKQIAINKLNRDNLITSNLANSSARTTTEFALATKQSVTALFNSQIEAYKETLALDLSQSKRKEIEGLKATAIAQRNLALKKEEIALTSIEDKKDKKRDPVDDFEYKAMMLALDAQIELINATTSWGDSLTGAAKIIQNISKALGDIAVSEIKADKAQRKLDKDKSDAIKKLAKDKDYITNKVKIEQAHIKATKKITEDSLRSQINGYAALAGAMAGAFAEGSDGAKAFMVIQQTLALYNAVGAVLQAWNSAIFPYNLPAVAATSMAVAGLLAQIGQTIGGGGSGSEPSKPAGYTEDTTEQYASDSIVDVLERIYDVQYPLLDLTRSMRDALVGVTNNIIDLVKDFTLDGLDFDGSEFVGMLKDNSSYTLDSIKLLLGTGTLDEYVAGTVEGVLQTWAIYENERWYGDTRELQLAREDILSDAMMGQIGDATSAMAETIFTAGDSLGLSQEAIDEALANVVLDFGTIDTTDLSEQEIVDKILSTISYAFDDVISTALPELDRFREIGEGYYETLLRIAIETEQAGVMFDVVGKSIGDWVESAEILKASGGLSAFTSNMNDFMSLFTEDEQLAMQVEMLTKQFEALGVVIPETNQDFIDLVNSTTDPELYADLLSLSGAFGELDRAAENLASSVQDVIDAWMSDLSYLTIAQKDLLASSYLDIATEDDTISTVDAARSAAEAAMAASSTKEEYIPAFERYIAALEDEIPEATTDDVVARLDTLIIAIREMDDTLIKTQPDDITEVRIVS